MPQSLVGEELSLGPVMDRMLVLSKNENGKSYFVLKNKLERLIEMRKIQQFRRSDGWLDIDKAQRRDEKTEYKGPERRLCRKDNWNLFQLSIEQQLRKGISVEAILGQGQRAREIAFKLKSLANTDLSVLILGKTGTGKGVAASILHELSNRKDRPFIRVDCGAIPPTLIESELFGHEKGSFTGAFRSRPGRFQRANGGTILLDEIANLSMDMQTRLLGFLEERMVNSIGGASPIKINVRIISSTNANLTDQIQRNQFREDLFYRLSEFQIQMPPLSERPDDIFYLATKFVSISNAELGKNVFGFSEKAIDFLSGYDWIGNIREMRNMIRKATLFSNEVIEVEHLLDSAREEEATASLDRCLENAMVKCLSLHDINDMLRKKAEKRIIERVYAQSYKNKKKTCKALGIDYSTLYRKMKDYGIE